MMKRYILYNKYIDKSVFESDDYMECAIKYDEYVSHADRAYLPGSEIFEIIDTQKQTDK